MPAPPRIHRLKKTLATLAVLTALSFGFLRAADDYVVYEGKNPDTGLPIIKVFLNPLVMWIWIGVGIIIGGTFVALTPNISAALVARRVITTPLTVETDREVVQVGS